MRISTTTSLKQNKEKNNDKQKEQYGNAFHFGVYNLIYYASGIIEECANDMHASEQFPTIDKKQRREIQEKKQGIIMSEM